MTKDYLDLVKKYPKLYKHLNFFECGPGWYDIIDDLSSKLEKEIEALAKDGDGSSYAVQVKEKYGTLRFYVSLETEKMGDLIEQAEEKTQSTCEVCGKEGKLIGEGWMKVRCKKHEGD